MGIISVNKRKFKNYLLFPEFQLKFIALLAGTNILISLILVVSTCLFFYKSPTLFGVMQYLHSDTSITFRAELNQFLIVLGCLTLAFIALISFVALVLSHRTVGPVFRFKAVFEEIAAGNLKQRIHLRPHDDFQDVAQSFNRMMDRVTEKSKNGEP
jgi:methyl-accepting chemotaxis protein